MSQIFVIKEIKCRTQEGNCSQEVIDFNEILKGKNVIFLNRDGIEEKMKNIFPLEHVSFQFTNVNTVEVSILDWQKSLDVNVIQVSAMPNLSMDENSLATQSSWARPIDDIEGFTVGLPRKSAKLYSKGKMVTQSNDLNSQINLLSTGDIPEDYLSDLYSFILLSTRYLSNPKIYIIGDRLFLRQSGLPDIIINVMSDKANTEFALQSIDYLITIKKDAKVVDLEFKHPIIK